MNSNRAWAATGSERLAWRTMPMSRVTSGSARGMKRNWPGSAGKAKRGRVVMPMPASIIASREIMLEM
ncbi:hypothetical protein D3C84_493500 [compost metagenome]